MGQMRRQFSAVITMAIGATLLPVLFATEATANGSAQITDIRVGNHKDKTRLVLDVTKPMDLRYEVSADGSAVFIDLPRVKWAAGQFKGRHFKGLITDFKFSPEANGGRFNILTNAPVRIRKPFFLGPNSRLGHRVVIDIIKDQSPTLMVRQQPEGTQQRQRASSPVPRTTLETQMMVAGPGAMPRSASPFPNKTILAGHESRAGLMAQKSPPVQLRQQAGGQIQRQPPHQMPRTESTIRQQGYGGILGFQNIYLKHLFLQ